MAVKATDSVTLIDFTDVDHVDTWYQKTSSMSAPAKPTTTIESQTPTGWSKTEPTYTAGTTEYLWTCQRNVFADNSVWWGDVQKSMSFEAAKQAYNAATAASATANAAKDAVDGLEIGGRNLLRWTAISAENLAKLFPSGVTTVSLTSIDGYPCYELDTTTNAQNFYGGSTARGSYLMDANTTYTYSATIKVVTTTDVTTIPLDFSHLGHFSVHNSASTATDKTHEDVPAKRVYYPSNVNVGEWTRIHIQFTTNNLDKSGFGVYPKYALNAAGYTVYIRDMKLEKGNKATDWTPALEDASNECEYAICSTAAATAAKTATCDGFHLYKGATVHVQFSNGNTAVKPSLDVNSTGAKWIRAFDGSELAASEYTIGALSVMTLVYDGTYWRLMDDGVLKRITVAETEIVQSNEAIALRATKEYVDSIEIGGRNLLKNASLASDLQNWSTTGLNSTTDTFTTEDDRACLTIVGATGTVKYIRQSLLDEIKKDEHGQIYTFSCEAKLVNYAAGSTNPFVQIYVSGNYVNGSGQTVWLGGQPVSGEPDVSQYTPGVWNKVSYTFKINETPATSFDAYVYARDFTGTLYIRNLKFERGAKSTDWTPATEDLATSAELTVTNNLISSKVSSNGVISAINQSTENIQIDVSNVDLQVGGRNLLRYSKPSAENLSKVTGSTNVSYVTEDSYPCYLIAGSYNTPVFWYNEGHNAPVLEADTTYTYSAWVKLIRSSGSETEIDFYFLQLGHFAVINSASTATDKTHEDVANKRIYSPSKVPVGEWTRISITFTTNSLGGSLFGVFPIYALDISKWSLYIRDFKLEKGNVATDWTPATEDLATSAELKVQADRIGMVVSNADASSSLALTSDAMTYIGGHVEIKGTDGTTTAITGGKIQTKAISIGDLSGDISGRNLLLDSGTERQITNTGFADYELSAWAKANLKSTDDLVLSFDVVANGQTYMDCYWRSASGTPYNQTAYFYPSWSAGTTKTHVEVTDTVGNVDLSSLKWLRFRTNDAEHQTATSTYGASISNVMLVRGTMPTDWTPAPEDVASDIAAVATTASGANFREQIIYKSQIASASAPSALTTWCTTATGGQNAWTTVRPEYSQSYPALYTAVQRQTVAQAANNGTTCSCTTPALDKTTTVIDGGNIITNSIHADRILTDEIQQIGPTSGKHMSLTANGVSIMADQNTELAKFTASSMTIGNFELQSVVEEIGVGNMTERDVVTMALDGVRPAGGTPSSQGHMVLSPLLIFDCDVKADSISLESPLSIANGGTNATTAAAALENLGALPDSGGYMSGTLNMKAGNIADNVTVSEDQAGRIIAWRDNPNNIIGYIQPWFKTDKTQYMQFTCRRLYNGANRNNNLMLGVKDDGTYVVEVTSPFAWRNGINAAKAGVVKSSSSSQISMATGYTLSSIYTSIANETVLTVSIAFKNTNALTSGTEYAIGTLASTLVPYGTTFRARSGYDRDEACILTSGAVTYRPRRAVSANSTLYVSATYVLNV